MFSLEFLVTSFVVVLVPGTGVVYAVSTGLIQGRRAAIFAALGGVAGIVPHLLATILGLAAVLHTSALAWQALKYAGALYLFYIAWATWRDRSALAVDATAGGPGASGASGWNIVVKAVLLNVLNPKLTIFFLAFLPQFVDAGAGAPMQQMLGLSAVFMLMTFVVFVAYGLLAHAFRVCVIDSPLVQDVLRRTFAASFAGLGAHLALSER